MPFIPHTEADVRAMLDVVGAEHIDQLFDEVPAGMRTGDDPDERGKLPRGHSEMDMLAWMRQRAQRDEVDLCFLGAGCYDHHIPAAVWDLAERGEFLTAYTPYQAEASQGTLQVIYEYQTMMAALTGMEVSNASVYDGASGLAESILMAVRANKKAKSRRVLIADTVDPRYRATARTIVRNQGIELVGLPMTAQGRIDAAELTAGDEPPVALVVQHPNFFGLLEDVDALADWAADNRVLLIAVANPLSLSLLRPPGEWGRQGADIACGDGQPFGIPMASGGPSFGYLCCRRALVRQMPGRLIGRTVDLDGKSGFTLTLQAREQHIRRAKATSNICTNQGLLVTAATIHLSLLGADGLAAVASRCHNNTRALTDALTRIPGVKLKHGGAFFHERVMELPVPAAPVAAAMAERRVLCGYPLGRDFPSLERCLLVCATEKRTTDEIERCAMMLADVLAAQSQQAEGGAARGGGTACGKGGAAHD